VECSLDVEVLAHTLLLTLTVTFPNHAVFIFIFELPHVLLEDIVNLFFDVETIPEVKVVDFFVVLCDVFLNPNVIKDICSDTHPPDMFAMLHEEILGQLGAGRVHFVHQAHELRRRQLADPLVHKLAW
jgi:hypothetical protein